MSGTAPPLMPAPAPVAADTGLSGASLPLAPEPARVVGESWHPAEEPGAFENAWGFRWGLRNGTLSLPAGPTGEARNQPDAAGYDALRSPTEPRRGSMRLSPSGGPQQPQTPAPVQYPDPIGPPMPDRGGASGALDSVLNTLLAAQQGITEAGLSDGKVVNLPEVNRVLRDPNDGDATDLAGRLRQAQVAAQAAGVDVVFRVGATGQIEAVERSADMNAPGGAFGRVADAVGRLLGLGMVDPLAGAAAMGARGTRGTLTATSSGGVGPARSSVLPNFQVASSPSLNLPPDSPFKNLPLSDLEDVVRANGGDVSNVARSVSLPLDDDVIYSALRPSDRDALREIPAQNRPDQIASALQRAAQNGIYLTMIGGVEPRISRWDGQTWVPAGSWSGPGAADAEAAIALQLAGRVPLLNEDRFDALMLKAWDAPDNAANARPARGTP